MFTSVKKFYKPAVALLSLAALLLLARWVYSNPNFGGAFAPKAARASRTLAGLDDRFALCAPLCNQSATFLQALVFPEVMRFDAVKDDVEAESLRVLYTQLGEDYANFSIGLFQMKPSFARTVEEKARHLLSPDLLRELQLGYQTADPMAVREQRVERLCDPDWQLVYLTAFVAICNRLYQGVAFASEAERLQWYATVYNAGFHRGASYIRQTIARANRYLQQGMPEKKFRYTALATWYFNQPAAVR